jgi:hypothetical protein
MAATSLAVIHANRHDPPLQRTMKTMPHHSGASQNPENSLDPGGRRGDEQIFIGKLEASPFERFWSAAGVAAESTPQRDTGQGPRLKGVLASLDSHVSFLS